jgi:hypothetical protein
MAKKIKPPVAVPVVDAPKIKVVALSFSEVEQRVAELEADLQRLAKLCGDVWGEPLASAALEIATKRQGAK